MSTALFLFALLTAPSLEVSVAPDQPVPYVYVDEPVILQIKSSEDTQAAGSVTITDDTGKSTAITLPTLPLRANGAHWQPLDGAPKEKGRYTAHVTLDVNGSAATHDVVYCRIDRPGDDARAPLRTTVNTPEPAVLHALRGIPLREITVPITAMEVATLVESASADGFSVSIALDAAAISDIPSLAELAKKLGDRVDGWRVSIPEIGVETLEPLAAALRDGGSRSQLEVVLNSGLANIDALLVAGLGRNAFKVFLPASANSRADLEALRDAFEKAGYEGFRLQTLFGAPDKNDDGSNHWSVARDVLGSQAPGGLSPEIDVTSVYAAGGFGESYTLLSAIAHRLNGYTYFDELTIGPRSRAVVFRNNGTWIVAVWSTAQPAVQSLPVAEATEVAATDASNNPLPKPEMEGVSMKLALTTAPIYVSGKGGPLLSTVARASARQEAESFTKNSAFQKKLPPEFVELIKPIAAANFSRVDRVSFFALLRMFPVLEQKWHDGTLPREIAVPAMASLSRLVRSLCVIEQDSNEPFIELLQDTIARCGDYQSQYLTSTGGTAEKHERADWLLAEVARLTAEAKALADNERMIEAVGVASLAEWRARSLEFARNAAPLGAPEPAREVAAEPKPEPKPAPVAAPSAKTPKPATKKATSTSKKKG
ncbi:MAG: hypothetical protein IT367_08520 [Candidatus Hydrogenedentes bacterium]|nr:hypothetical protein [Candidatus Hydrogenedentota bacterium]